MVKSGEKYFYNIEFLKEIITEFNSTVKELSVAINNIGEVIDEITIASNEIAIGSKSINTQSIVILKRTNKVVEQTFNSQKISKNLIKIVSKFKVE
ncbi:hypothetical protein LF65_05880 [Clostridium beijerinckii]|uniref:Methyl-accepting chemotaxis sensory transducer n=1 Tax=Clostridium beijerinckii TaxID=1520 RepID=A0A140DM83_CLOBE|nr:hypothetical protein [Clostridium beijerinckii]AMK50346.1 hypothetical protein LF65_05880 [Clostridium beijerinckii]